VIKLRPAKQMPRVDVWWFIGVKIRFNADIKQDVID